MTSRHFNSFDLNPAIALADRITKIFDREELNAYQLINVLGMLSASLAASSTVEPRQRQQYLATIHSTAVLHLDTLENGASNVKDS